MGIVVVLAKVMVLVVVDLMGIVVVLAKVIVVVVPDGDRRGCNEGDGPGRGGPDGHRRGAGEDDGPGRGGTMGIVVVLAKTGTVWTLGNVFWRRMPYEVWGRGSVG